MAEPAPPGGASSSPSLVTLESPTIRLEATPAIPDQLRARLTQYVNARSASVADIADDGSRLLVTTRFGETTQLHLLTAPMGARTQLTFGDEPIHVARFAPTDAHAFLYTAAIGGNEQDQIYRLDTRSGHSTLLTDAGARNGEPVWSHDGKWLAYSSNSRNMRDFDIWIADGRDPGSARRVVDGVGWWRPLDFSPDGKRLLVGRYISINESELYAVELATGALARISPETNQAGQKASYPEACFGAGSSAIYVASDREGEFRELYETNLAGSSWQPLTRSIPWDVEAFAFSGNGRALVFTTNQGGYSTLSLLDPRTRKLTAVPGIPKGIIGGLVAARRAPVVAFTLASATSTGDAYTYDIKRKKLTRWTASEMGGLSPDSLSEPALIEYESFDGKSIPAFYYRPAGSGPFPVIIVIHGGPEGQSRPVFSPLTQYFVAERGVAMLYPNVRGSNGYGKSYLLLDNGMHRADSVKDIGGLLDWIDKQPELDKNRVGVLGGSYGGYMVLASLVHFGKRIAAGVDMVGISSFTTFLQNTAEYRRDLRRAEYGDERDPEMKAFLDRISPLSNVAKIESALFVAQGANDPRVPASEAQQIVEAVRAAGQEVWYMLAKNEGHGFAKKDNRDLYDALVVMFFEKYLINALSRPVPAPSR